MASGLNLNAGNLAEKFARGIGSRVRGIEQNVGGIARAEFEAVAALQFLALDALSVDEGAVLAAQVDQEKILSLLHDLGVVARDARVGDDQVFINLAADVERRAVQDNVLLLGSLYEDKRGKHTGTGAVADGVQGHE